MKKTTSNLTLLSMIFAVSLVIANVVTSKLINTGIPLFGENIILPGAAVCYAVTYLCTDVIGEIWGVKEANTCVKFGFVCQILSTVLIIFTQALPAVDPAMQQSYNMLLGQNWIFVIGSLVAYYLSQSWDVKVFHTIRQKYLVKHNSTKHRWIWNNVSTLTSQVIDTVVFIGISFGLGFGWFFNREMWLPLATMMVGQYILKAALALLDTPLFYLLTRGQNNEINKKAC